MIPAPQVGFKKIYNTTEDGTPIGATWQITVRGILSAYKGSPNSSGTFWTVSGYPPDEVIGPDSRLGAILRKQEGIRKLFSTQGLSFEIQPYDGSPSVKFNPRIKEIDFPEGKWVEVCPYEIQMEADVIYVNGGALGEDNLSLVSKAADAWHIEILNEFTREYKLTHTLSATGKLFYDVNGNLTKPAWQNAQDYVLNKLGLGLDPSMMIANGVLGLTTWQAFNYVRSQTVGETSGIFEASETWLCFDTSFTPDGIGGGIPAVEILTVTTRQSIDDGRINVSLEGSITGLEQRDNNTGALITTRSTNAATKYNTVVPFFQTRAQNFSGQDVNPIPISKQVATNPINGTINYNFQYNNRASPVTENALSEIISVNDNSGSDLFAILPVPGRALGPILQGLSTIKENRRDISIEIVMPAATVGFTYFAPNTDAIVATLVPAAGTLFKDRDQTNWIPFTGRYSRTVGFVYQ